MNLSRWHRKAAGGGVPPVKPCAKFGGGHYWRLSPHEKYISRGECECGAVRFEADTFEGDPEFRQWMDTRLKQLNKTEGKEGNMPAQIKASELRPETREKLGIEKGADSSKEHQAASQSTRASIPSRPDLAGVKHGQIGGIMNKYYEANAPAILADRETLGDRETRSRWGFSECGYEHFLKRRGLTFEGRAPSKPRQKKGDNPPPSTKAEVTEPYNKSVQLPEPKAPEPEPEKPPSDAKVPAGFTAFIYLPAPGNLPDFPEFDKAWPDSIKLRWLDVFSELARR